jgi:hypothetical protein
VADRRLGLLTRRVRHKRAAARLARHLVPEHDDVADNAPLRCGACLELGLWAGRTPHPTPPPRPRTPARTIDVGSDTSARPPDQTAA